MNLTMCVVTRHHMVVGKASVCRGSAETRHRSRNPLLPRHSMRGDNGALAVPKSLTVSARSAQSTNRRLFHHQVVSGGDINGLTHPARPLSRVQKPRCELRSDCFPRVRRYAPERRNGHGAGRGCRLADQMTVPSPHDIRQRVRRL